MDMFNWSHTTLEDVHKLLDAGKKEKAMALLKEHENQIARAYKALAQVHGEMTAIGEMMKNMGEEIQTSPEPSNEGKIENPAFKESVDKYEELAHKIGDNLKQIKVHIKLSG